MIPNTLIVAIVFIIVYLLGYFFRSSRRIKMLINKKSNHTINFVTKPCNRTFEQIVFTLVKHFDYNVEYLSIEKNKS